MVKLDSFFYSKEINDILPKYEQKTEQQPLMIQEIFTKAFKNIFTRVYFFLVITKVKLENITNGNNLSLPKYNNVLYSDMNIQQVEQEDLSFPKNFKLVWQNFSWQEIYYLSLSIPLMVILGFITILKPKQDFFNKNHNINGSTKTKQFNYIFSPNLQMVTENSNCNNNNRNDEIEIQYPFYKANKINDDDDKFNLNTGQSVEDDLYFVNSKKDHLPQYYNTVGSIRSNVVGINSLSKQNRDNSTLLFQNTSFFKKSKLK